MLLIPMDAKFFPGALLITPGALAAFRQAGDDLQLFFSRHLRGDWGDLDGHDRRVNEVSLQRGYRLLSAYSLNDGTRFWIITEADRSMTTILLPEEY